MIYQHSAEMAEAAGPAHKWSALIMLNYNPLAVHISPVTITIHQWVLMWFIKVVLALLTELSQPGEMDQEPAIVTLRLG